MSYDLSVPVETATNDDRMKVQNHVTTNVRMHRSKSVSSALGTVVTAKGRTYTY